MLTETVAYMILRIDGHEIPIATAADFTGDELAAHNTRRTYDAASHAEMEIPTGIVRGKSVPFNMSHGGDPGSGCTNFTVVPPAADDNPALDLASLRPVRIVGHENDRADRKHRRELFLAVGAITVAGGHVEMALRKVLATLKKKQNRELASKDIPADWNVLHNGIREHCAGDSSDMAQRVLELLNAAEESKLREIRNNIVHSYWWLLAVDSGELWSGRYYKGSKPPGSIVTTAESLLEQAERLFDYAAELEALVTPHWPLALVPAINSVQLGAQPTDLVARTNHIDIGMANAASTAAAWKPKPGQKSPGRTRKKRKRR